MPPTWPSRLLSGPTTPTSEAALHHTSPRSNKPLPSVPSQPESGGSRTHSHTRSSSHPLPRIFAKRRGSSVWGKHDEEDESVDASVAPVLDGLVAGSPVRTGSGRKRVDDDPLQTRLCMCCGQRVRFPRDLRVFRCTQCLTINDLVPYRPQIRQQEMQDGAGTGDEQHDSLPSRRKSATVTSTAMLT